MKPTLTPTTPSSLEVPAAPRRPLRRFGADLRRFFPYVTTSAAASLKTDVSSSHLGWLWWILEPLLFMMVYTFIALVVFQRSMPYFPVFVFIGLTVWQFFNRNVTQSVTLMRHSRGIIRKVYIPKQMLMLEALSVNAFKSLLSLALVFVLMPFFKVPFPVRVWQILPELLLLVLFTFGFSLILMHVGVYVGDLSNAIHVILRLFFYLSGVFYDITSRVPAPWNYYLVRVNPVALVMASMRSSLLYQTDPDWIWLGGWTLVSAVLVALAIRLVYKQENSYAKVL